MSGNELGAPVAELGGSSIPDEGLAEIRLHIRAAAIKLAKRKDSEEVVLLAGAAKVAFGADDVARQPISGKPHDRGAVEPLCIVCFGGLLEPEAGSRLILRPPLARDEQAPDGDAGAHMPLLGR